MEIDMFRKFQLVSAVCLLGVGSLSAQRLQPDTLLMSAAQKAEEVNVEADDASDFTFTESQLDEDMDAMQTIAIVTSSTNDPFRANVGFAWSATRFRLRSLDNMYSTTFLNGLEFNDLESGRYNYSLLGGLNDATRQKEGATGFEVNSFGVTGIGGGENINLRASRFAAGNKLTLTACNRNYRYRGMYTFATGLMNNGWALAGTVGFRYADEGVIEGTFYNSLSYLLSAEKHFGDEHTLALVTFGAPTERGQQGASTEEAYWLANSHYYNPNWGYQDGKKRNSRVVKDFSPTAILSWEWNLSQDTRLTTNAAFKYANYSSSALGWGGEAYDPRPDYYKNLPSGVFNVYDTDPNGHGNNDKLYGENAFLLEEYNRLYDMWQTKANRQVNWDRMYYVNQQNGEALYYLERRHNDQMVWSFSTTFNQQLSRRQRVSAGFYFNHTQGMHYKTMDDLLGGSRYLDIDKFAAGDYGMNSIQAQPDIRKPNRYVGKDDKFGYDYNTYVNLEKLWAQYNYHSGSLNVDLSGHLASTHMQREGLMRNGQGMSLLSDAEAIQKATAEGRTLIQYNGKTYVDNSFGTSDWATFVGGGIKGKATWAPVLNHRFSLGGSWEKKAPTVRNAFVAPRVQNNFVKNLSLEDVIGAEAEYMFQAGIVRGSVTGYYLTFRNTVEQTAFFNDAYSAFTYLTMSKLDRRHYGVEAAVDVDLSFLLENLTFRVMGTYGEAEYTNNPYAELTTEGMSNADNAKVNTWKNPVTGAAMPLKVIAEDMKVNGTPLTALNLGLKYNKNYWFFEVNANYYDRVYIGFSPYRRLTNIMGNHTPSVDGNGNLVYAVSAAELADQGGVLFREDGTVRKCYSPDQEKAKGGWMIDASVGKSIRLRHGKSMSINLQMQNLTNNTNIKTGGYEQNRDDSYYKQDYASGTTEKGLDKAYKFSKNSKYYYANAINFFFNVGYKF